MRRIGYAGLALILACAAEVRGQDDASLRARALGTMEKATTYFGEHVATKGGYLWTYSTDFTHRRGEGRASETTVWVQSPGTPTIGLVYLDAYEATEEKNYLQAAREVGEALIWEQLSSGGWDYRIDFDPDSSKAWHYRRDVEAGDQDPGERHHISVLDDNTSQEAIRMLVRLDKALGFDDEAVHSAAVYALDALLKVQYPNGAWPQRWATFPEPADYPVVKARYPASWPRVWPDVDYHTFYTFNDTAMADVVDVMLEASKIYGESAYREAALRCGEFMLMAQMPEPQPAWAQQYNRNMEPVWARRFEPPGVSGRGSFNVMHTLINLYEETGQERFIATDPPCAGLGEAIVAAGRTARSIQRARDEPPALHGSGNV